MTKYLVLYMSPVSAREMMADSTPEQMQAGMDLWLAWANENREAIVDLGMPLGATKRIDPSGISDSDSTVSGYSVLQAESADEVAKILAGHPHLQTPGGASIDVLEYLAVPGM